MAKKKISELDVFTSTLAMTGMDGLGIPFFFSVLNVSSLLSISLVGGEIFARLLLVV